MSNQLTGDNLEQLNPIQPNPVISESSEQLGKPSDDTKQLDPIAEPAEQFVRQFNQRLSDKEEFKRTLQNRARTLTEELESIYRALNTLS